MLNSVVILHFLNNFDHKAKSLVRGYAGGLKRHEVWYQYTHWLIVFQKSDLLFIKHEMSHSHEMISFLKIE